MMKAASNRARTLIIGCDYTVFFSYWRYYAQSQEREICGFVSMQTPAPISYFKGNLKAEFKIYALKKLESVIIKKRIQKCVIQTQNQNTSDMRSVIYRILSTGVSSIEFIPLDYFEIHSFKPIIAITSLAPFLGKSQLARYVCAALSQNKRRVAVIIPLIDIPHSEETLRVDECPHYQFMPDSEIPQDVLPPEAENLARQYQKSGAYRVFVTSDVRRAIICAEQSSDIIVYDAYKCELPLVDSDAKCCLVSENTLEHIAQGSLWPGLVNLMSSQSIVVVSRDAPIPKERRESLQRLFKEREFYYVRSEYTLEDASFIQVFNKKTLTIDLEDTPQVAKKVALKSGGQVEGESIVVSVKNAKSIKSISDAINTSQADVVIANIPDVRIPDLDPLKQVIFTSPEIDDSDGSFYGFISKFFVLHTPPPLKSHFEAQVDIIMSFSKASEKELSVTNNDSANREAFCRLFLSSHLPPGFRVTTGEIIDCDNNTTGQLDVVIVNSDSPRMTLDSTNRVIAPILADTVLGVIEVKTTLTVEHLKKALSQMRPVKALMPTHETLETADGEIIKDPLGGKIIAGIFGFYPTPEMEQKVPQIIELYPNVADFIVMPDSFCYFNKETLKVCGLEFGEHELINGYYKFSAKGIGLALIFGVLNNLAATRRFSGSNCVRYLSGVWGGGKDHFDRAQSEAKKSLKSLSDLITKGQPVEVRNRIYSSAQKYIQAIEDIGGEKSKQTSAEW